MHSLIVGKKFTLAAVGRAHAYNPSTGEAAAAAGRKGRWEQTENSSQSQPPKRNSSLSKNHEKLVIDVTLPHSRIITGITEGFPTSR